jgi:ankyrin repeat protein
VVRMLLDTGVADVDARDVFGRAPLSWATENGNDAMVQLLLGTENVDVDSRNNTGQTSLSRATEDVHPAAMLDTAQIDVHARDKTGCTSAENGDDTLLLDPGEVHARDKTGRIPLPLVAGSGNDVVVKPSLNSADVNVMNQHEAETAASEQLTSLSHKRSREGSGEPDPHDRKRQRRV